MPAIDYPEKFERIRGQTLFDHLPADDRLRVRELAGDYRLTQQELRRLVEICLDFSMWRQESPLRLWREWERTDTGDRRRFKKRAMARLARRVEGLVAEETRYDAQPVLPQDYGKTRVRLRQRDKREKVFGMCPVYSERTLCCNLRTIDAVRNCGFACSYCSIQTMFTEEDVQFDADFAARLDAIELDPERCYHIGTGQSSDALMWGNKHGILDNMLAFARKWPRALIEFKTKSRNVRYFLDRDLPRNIVCSWSVNPDPVIENEEHRCASMMERLEAARRVADRGIKVAFHLHPMIHFADWRPHYAELIDGIRSRFDPEEVLFVSFGTLTFPRPVLKEIRARSIQTQILRMDMVPNPEGKMTYPDEVKTRLFRFAADTFGNWRERVFFYLCMEEKRHWRSAFGFCYDDNNQFERAFHRAVWAKLAPGSRVNDECRLVDS